MCIFERPLVDCSFVNLDNASLTIALAMASGILAQAAARHLRVPGIVLLLGVGIILGPDVANLIRPDSAGSGLNAFVGFAVAIILFEGGLHMNLKKLRTQAKPIRRLVTVGAVVTAAAAAIAVKLIMGWDWRLSALFGTLVIVTGPTVITPLLRRLRVRRNISTILEAEGIFIDAIGATIAVVALDVLVSNNALGVIGLFSKIAIGTGVGLVGGVLLALLLSRRRLIPEGLENPLALAFGIAVFQIAHAISHESGITAAIVAGMVVANTKSHAFVELVEFKEQLVTLLVATLFVLLSADVRIDDVLALGYPGVYTVLVLMFIVRPLTVAISTYSTDLTLREKMFLGWLGPRGIVAAAVASLFAAELAGRGIENGESMKALVFLVIAMTVTIQGLSGGLIARVLKLKRPNNVGYAILGANPLARAFGRTLRAGGDAVVLLDANPDACELARADGFEVICGNGLENKTIDLAMIDARIATIALTTNENVNFLFARKIKELYKGSVVYVALETAASGVTPEMLEENDTRLLFGAERHLALWSDNMTLDRIAFETWELNEQPADGRGFSAAPVDRLLPLAIRSGKKVTPIDSTTQIQKGYRLRVAMFRADLEGGRSWLRDQGFVPHREKSVGTATESHESHESHEEASR